jgi:hypothetical protein
MTFTVEELVSLAPVIPVVVIEDVPTPCRSPRRSCAAACPRSS